MRKIQIYKILAFIFYGLLLHASCVQAHLLYLDKKNPVGRAGVVLVKKYDEGDFAVLVGKDSKFTFVNFPAGQVSKDDKYIFQTAARETREETGGVVRLKPEWLSKQSYVYSKHYKTLLYVIRKDSVGVTEINNSIKKLKSKKNTPYAYREVDHYYAIPVDNLIKAAKAVRKAGFPQNSHAPCYHVVSRSNASKNRNGISVRIERHYLNVIAENIDSFERFIHDACNRL